MRRTLSCAATLCLTLFAAVAVAAEPLPVETIEHDAPSVGRVEVQSRFACRLREFAGATRCCTCCTA